MCVCVCVCVCVCTHLKVDSPTLIVATITLKPSYLGIMKICWLKNKYVSELYYIVSFSFIESANNLQDHHQSGGFHIPLLSRSFY